jgi:hypothetical protein
VIRGSDVRQFATFVKTQMFLARFMDGSVTAHPIEQRRHGARSPFRTDGLSRPTRKVATGTRSVNDPRAQLVS